MQRGKWERTFDARKFGEIIDDDITCMDVVVDERNPSFAPPPGRQKHCGELGKRHGSSCRTWTQFFLSDLDPVLPVEYKHAFEDMNESGECEATRHRHSLGIDCNHLAGFGEA